MRETYSNFNLSRYKLKKYVSLSNFRYAPPIKSNFDQFNKYIKTNMSFYNISQSTDTNRAKLSFNKSPIRLEQKEKDFIKQMTEEKNNSRNINKNSSQNTINNSKELQINTSISTPKDLYLYMNPLHSLSILRINNKVRSNIIQLNLKRQRYIFDKTIYDLSNSKIHYINSLSRIKISQLSPINTNNIVTLRQSEISKIPSLRQNSLRNIFKSNPGKNKNLLFCHMYTRLNASYAHWSKTFPESREQFTFVTHEDNHNIYLIGGIFCVNECDEIWKYDINHLSWEKIKSKNMTKCRFGHTAILNKNNTKIFVFGGVSKLDIWKNSITKGGEENYGNFEIFDLIKKEWYTPIKSKFHPSFRRNHSCELIGNDLIILLGISKENEVLNDAFVLNISFPHNDNERWEEVHVDKVSEGPRLYGHTSALVFDEEILNSKKCGVYYIPDEFRLKNNKGKLKNSGIYVFGGKNKYTGGIASNDIYLFHIGQDPCWWERIDNVKGNKPSPRYFHSMNYYKPGNFLIIHGGKNINSLNDTFLFDLANYQWNRIILSGIDESLILPRNGHQSAICGNQLFIFGGVNNGNYIGSGMFIINLIPNVLNMLLLNVLSIKNNNMENPFDKKDNKEENKKKIKFPKIK